MDSSPQALRSPPRYLRPPFGHSSDLSLIAWHDPERYDSMGDVRYDIHLERLGHAHDRAQAIREMDDEAVISALGAASKTNDPLLANVLTTEILNRVAEKNRIISHLGEGVFRLRADGTVAFLNEAAATLLGLSATDIIGRDLHEVIHVDAHGDALPREDCPILTVLATSVPLSLDREHFGNTGGRVIPVDCTATPVFREGQIDGVVVIFRDVTSLVHAEAELRASDQRHRDLFDKAPNAYFEVGLDERVTNANLAAHEMLSYQPGGLVGLPVFDLHPPTGAGHARAVELFERFAAGHEVINEELEMIRSDGGPVWVSLTVRPLRDAEGRIVKARVIAVDVSARREANEQLRESADFVRFNPSPVLRIGANGTIAQANPAAYEFFADDHLVGKKWASICPAGDAALSGSADRGTQRTAFVERGGRRLALTYRSIPRAGSTYVYSFSCGDETSQKCPYVARLLAIGEQSRYV